ncbi:MAG: arginine--tRNA ligase, partial [Anaerolineae bacterium]|nr:arginine--tRNA ligase [Anaerolineae bacterium]
MPLLPPQLASLIGAAITAAQVAGDLPPLDLPTTIPVQRSSKPEQGDYASPVAMQLARLARRKPLDVAESIARHMPPAPFVAALQGAPPGFPNVRLDESGPLAQIDAIPPAGEEGL